MFLYYEAQCVAYGNLVKQKNALFLFIWIFWPGLLIFLHNLNERYCRGLREKKGFTRILSTDERENN